MIKSACALAAAVLLASAAPVQAAPQPRPPAPQSGLALSVPMQQQKVAPGQLLSLSADIAYVGGSAKTVRFGSSALTVGNDGALRCTGKPLQSYGSFGAAPRFTLPTGTVKHVPLIFHAAQVTPGIHLVGVSAVADVGGSGPVRNTVAACSYFTFAYAGKRNAVVHLGLSSPSVTWSSLSAVTGRLTLRGDAGTTVNSPQLASGKTQLMLPGGSRTLPVTVQAPWIGRATVRVPYTYDDGTRLVTQYATAHFWVFPVWHVALLAALLLVLAAAAVGGVRLLRNRKKRTIRSAERKNRTAARRTAPAAARRGGATGGHRKPAKTSA